MLRLQDIIAFFVCIFFFCAAAFVQSCRYEKVYPVNSECLNEISYSAHVHPIIEAHCATFGCHVAGFQPGDFSVYSGLKKKADSGRLHFYVIELKNMPPDSSITDEQRTLIDCWIKQGAQNN